MIIFCSCDPIWFNEYKIVNNTEYNVEIKAFDTDNDSNLKNETIKIEPYSAYSILKADGQSSDFQGVFDNPAVDSVTITFADKRVIIQSCEANYGTACTFPRNIMNYNNESNYVKTKRGRSQGHKEYTYTYTITEEDYNNAVPID